ncbi:MAG TPA: hypothetical protein VM910_02370 [Bradyrhizobium sp.]|jgi:hypothetical protein|nr:hypothetical protein [Bradyrhizobium sp.]
MTSEEFLEERRQVAREYLDKGDTRSAIFVMFAYAQQAGMDRDDCVRLTQRALTSMSNDIEKVRRFVESWRVVNLDLQ